MEGTTDGGKEQHGATTRRILFVVLTQAPITPPTTEHLFDDPAAGQHRETDLMLGLTNNVHWPAEAGLNLGFPVGTRKAFIGADQRHGLA